MIKKLLIIMMIILCYSIVGESQQYYGQTWMTGRDGQQIIFNNNVITTRKGVHLYKYFTSGNSNICDTNGNILLSSDGMNIYDSNGAYLDGGDTLVPKDFYIHELGQSILSQSSIFLPMDSGIFYFITSTMSDSRFDDCFNNGGGCHFDLLLNNVIDMNANNGAGKVVKRMIPILENGNLRKTQMMACRHANGKDWWLLKNEGDSANVHTFLFTQDSVFDKGVQAFAEPIFTKYDTKGMSTFNPLGNQFASTSSGLSKGWVFLADFDRCYGKLSNSKVIQMPLDYSHDPSMPTQGDRTSVGLAYSPNGQFLYVVSQFNIFQYDFNDNTWFHVAGLDTTWSQFQQYATAYLGGDNKIYIGNWNGLSKQMSRIDNPDIKGVGCNFCPRCLRLDSLTDGYVGTPPCMPNYCLGSKVCYPESLLNPPKEDLNTIEVFPNPSSTKIVIRCRMSDVSKELYNSVGQLILSIQPTPNPSKGGEDEIDVRNLSKGVYYLRVGNVSKKVIVE